MRDSVRKSEHDIPTTAQLGCNITSCHNYMECQWISDLILDSRDKEKATGFSISFFLTSKSAPNLVLRLCRLEAFKLELKSGHDN